MNDIKTFHHQAMDYADKAFIAKRQCDFPKSKELYRRALNFELKAAKLTEKELSLEPTRSVLYRSAASLAIECEEYREAERLIAIALSGNPPFEIAEELRDLFEQVNFHRHLELKGIDLDPNEFQLSISGNGIGVGIAHTDAFITRLEMTERLIHRTAERKFNIPFREKGAPKKSLLSQIESFVSAPRSSSLAVTMRLGGAKEQLSLPGLDIAKDIIQELITCLGLFNDGEANDLKGRIPDEAYYRNFVNIARSMAPDGDKVKLVGFTSKVGGATNKVQLTRSRKEITLAEEAESVVEKGKSVKLRGQLLFADSMKETTKKIKLKDEKSKKHTIIVPKGMMSDIVKPLWEETVEVIGLQYPNGEVVLSDISKVQIDNE